MDLRSSKEEGQANFVNPGTIIVGTGLDADLTPKLRMQFNANYIRMVNPDVVKTVLFTNNVDRELGYDISLGFTYRPTLTNNIIINAGLGVMVTRNRVPGHLPGVDAAGAGVHAGPEGRDRQRALQRTHCDHADVLRKGGGIQGGASSAKSSSPGQSG